MSRFPYGVPNGWFSVSYSDDLDTGEVKAIKYFGKEMVLYRGQDGKARVLGAYCAHLGAHLGVGGKVVNNCIECPFHAWRYDGSGACVDIPYAEKIPPKALVDAWPVREINGNIYVWHHADGKEPEYELPALDQWGDAAWADSFRKYRWIVKTHPQEVMENTIDFEHFKVLHGMQSIDMTIFEAEGPMFHWGVGTRGDGELPAHMPERFKPKGERFMFCIWGQAWGVGVSPAYICNPGFDVVELASMTPIDEETTEINIGFLLQKKVLENQQMQPLLEQYLAGHAKALDQDIPIWENKLYRGRPVLSQGDGPIREFRDWTQQFYSNASKAA